MGTCARHVRAVRRPITTRTCSCCPASSRASTWSASSRRRASTWIYHLPPPRYVRLRGVPGVAEPDRASSADRARPRLTPPDGWSPTGPSTWSILPTSRPWSWIGFVPPPAHVADHGDRSRHSTPTPRFHRWDAAGLRQDPQGSGDVAGPAAADHLPPLSRALRGAVPRCARLFARGPSGWLPPRLTVPRLGGCRRSASVGRRRESLRRE